MERLTENVGNGVRLKECGNSICMAVCNAKRDCAECPIDEAFRKLAVYEDLEEQGLLVRVSRVKRRLEQFQKELTSQTIYKEGLPGSALDIVNILIADLAAVEGEEEG